MIKLYVYLIDGNVSIYSVENEWKAREHAEKIWSSGLRVEIKNRIEWLNPKYIDKICWDIKKADYLNKKYKSITIDK